jgi:sugar fermentation stimulation protein A
MRALGPLERARFLERPNRFLVRCNMPGRGETLAHLPNPGRLWELLLPGVSLYLARYAQPNPAGRRTEYKTVAVEREGRPVFLDTHATNEVARHLIERKRIPALAGAGIVRSEVAAGNSRFDFLLRENGRLFYAEVKSVTLFDRQVALFPDAITERGRRHLVELAGQRLSNAQNVALFVIHYPGARLFVPDYHTDLAFARTLLELKEELRVIPVAVRWTKDLRLGARFSFPDVPWDILQRETDDRGSYILILRIAESKTIAVGRLGALPFKQGYYLYVGSAMRHLGRRLARHQKKQKTRHWHIDYLRPAASIALPLAIRASNRLECEISRAMAQLFKPGPLGFGSSDCACPTHLFYSATNPIESRRFLSLLFRFRLQPFFSKT